MSFKIAPKATFTHDVTVMVPVDGGYVAETLKTTFNYVDQDEAKGFDLKTPDGQVAFVKRAVLTFHDLEDHEGKPVACSEELRCRLIEQRLEVRRALSDHFWSAVSKAAEGN